MLTDAVLPVIPDSLRKLYPYRTRTFSLDGERMSFVDEGAPSAPAVLLLHGNPTWSFLYRKSISKLAERFRVIAPDLIGFGLSDKPIQSGYHTFERHVENLERLIGALKLQKVTLALHDWGGPIGLGYAVRHSENVSRILLTNTFVVPRTTATQIRLPIGVRLLRGPAGGILIRRFNAMISPGLPAASAKRLSAEIMNGYRFPFVTPDSRTATIAFLRMIPLRAGDAEYGSFEQIATQLKAVKARVEILWGLKDPVFGHKLNAYVLRDSFPNAADPVFLPNAAHLIPEDAPEQITDKLLETFKPKPPKPVQLFNIIQ